MMTTFRASTRSARGFLGIHSLLLTVSLSLMFKADARAFKVCLDPGHGSVPGNCNTPTGADPGSQGLKCVFESRVNLKVAEKTRQLLQCQGQTDVFMTRYDETCVKLDERPQRAEDGGANYFVSVHHNSAGGTVPRICADTRLINPDFQGTSTYYYAQQQGGNAFAAHLLANAIHTRMLSALRFTDRNVLSYDYDVLVYATMPAVLGEASYMSNRNDELLLDPDHRDVDESSHDARIEAEAQAYTYGVRDFLGFESCVPTVAAIGEFSGVWDANGVTLTLLLNARPFNATGLKILREAAGFRGWENVAELNLVEDGEWTSTIRDTLALERGSIARYRLVATFPSEDERLLASVDVLIPPASATLAPSRPNPFNPRTQIDFALPQAGPATLSIYDAGGRRVAILVNSQTVPAGPHSVAWDGTSDNGREVASGIYFAMLETNSQKLFRRMVLLR